MTIRPIVLVAHRWLGLLTSIILSIVALSGVGLLWLAPSASRRFSNQLHEQVGLGRPGHRIVFWVTVAAIAVLFSGLLLWWKRKIVTVRTGAGLRLMLFDLHHSAGVLGFVFMLMLAVTAISMFTPRQADGIFAMMDGLHTARGYPFVVKLIYTVGTMVYVVQAVTGVVMWWKAGRRG